jgi:hypothetical protein
MIDVLSLGIFDMLVPVVAVFQRRQSRLNQKERLIVWTTF